MVDKKLIAHIISDSISKHYQWKCSQRLRLTERIRKAFNKCREETCNPSKPRKSEKGYLINEDGEIVYTKSGTKSSVSWDDKDLKKLYDEYGELNVEHNHPLYEVEEMPVFLSSDDINFITKTYGTYDDGTYIFKSVTCEGANGTRMSLVRGDNFNYKDRTKLQTVTKNYEKDVSDYYRGYLGKIPDTYYKLEADYMKNHPNTIAISVPLFNELYNQAEKEVLTDFNPYPIFKKYKPLFRECNMNLTWEEGL